MAVILLAAKFGLGMETDAYFVARLIPVTFVMPLGMAFNLSFIPTFLRARVEDGKEGAAELARSFINLTILGSLAFTVLYIIFSPWIIYVLAPGFPEQTQRLAVTLTRIMAFVIVLANIYAVFDSILNAERVFIIPALGSLWVPVATVLAILFLTNFWGITVIAVGVTAGFLLQVLTVAPLMPSYLSSYSFGIDLDNPRLREALKLLVFAGLIVAAWQINSAVDRFFGSLLDEGAVSALSLGFAFIGIVPLFITFSLYKVLYPELTYLVAAGRNDRLSDLFSWNFLIVTFITLPITMCFLLFSLPITTLFFSYGNFNMINLYQTARVIQFLSISLPPSIIGLFIVYYFYLTRGIKTIINVVLLSIFLNVLLDYTLMKILGLGGIALSSSLIVFFRLCLFVLLLKKSIGGPKLSLLFVPVVKICVATIFTGFVLTYMVHLFPGTLERGVFLDLMLTGIVWVFLGTVLYVLSNLALNNRQLLSAIEVLRNQKWR